MWTITPQYRSLHSKFLLVRDENSRLLRKLDHLGNKQKLLDGYVTEAKLLGKGMETNSEIRARGIQKLDKMMSDLGRDFSPQASNKDKHDRMSKSTESFYKKKKALAPYRFCKSRATTANSLLQPPKNHHLSGRKQHFSFRQEGELWIPNRSVSPREERSPRVDQALRVRWKVDHLKEGSKFPDLVWKTFFKIQG